MKAPKVRPPKLNHAVAWWNGRAVEWCAFTWDARKRRGALRDRGTVWALHTDDDETRARVADAADVAPDAVVILTRDMLRRMARGALERLARAYLATFAVHVVDAHLRRGRWEWRLYRVDTLFAVVQDLVTGGLVLLPVKQELARGALDAEHFTANTRPATVALHLAHMHGVPVLNVRVQS